MKHLLHLTIGNLLTILVWKIVDDFTSQLTFTIIIMCLSYILIENKIQRVNRNKSKVKYKFKSKQITSYNRGHVHQSLSKQRWHNSSIHNGARIIKHRRYITPKIKKKMTRVGCISKVKDTHHYKSTTTKCLMTKSATTSHTIPKFDSDSFLIGIDNHSSKCISPKLSDFLYPIKPNKGILNGISGKLSVFGSGTVTWKILDDEGNKHDLHIKDCLYVPEAPLRLLSPQQWGQQALSSTGDKGTWCATHPNKCILFWNNNQCKKTIPLDPASNVAIMRSAPGFSNYYSFAMMINKLEGNKHESHEKVKSIHQSTHHDNEYTNDFSLTHMENYSAENHPTNEDPNANLASESDKDELVR